MSQRGRADVVTKIDAATFPHASPKEALAAGIAYVLAGEYVYARYPLELATSLDGNYPEALHFLALTYDALAEFDETYREKAAEVREKRDLLTPKWIGS
jgi:Tfp pilus assembly protein PilF